MGAECKGALQKEEVEDMLGLGLGLGIGLEQFFCSIDPGIELGLTVFVTSRRYRQTNSAQALKETNRFTRPTPRIQAHTQGCHDATTMCRTVYLSIHNKLRTTVIGS